MQRTLLIAALAVSASALPAPAQTTLFGIGSGVLVRIDKATGAGVQIGTGIGLGAGNSAAADSQGRIITDGGPDQLIRVDPETGAGSLYLSLTGRPPGYGIRGLAFDPQDHLYAILSQADTAVIDLLARIDTGTGAYSVVGPTGRADLQGLACSGAGVLYAVGVFGGLFTLNPGTGAAAYVGGMGGFGGDDQTLEFDADGTLYCARNNLRRVDPVTGLTTLIGPIGSFDIRGLAMVPAAGPPACYANCDGSSITPVLNVNDFICFQTRFAAGETYANCDGSTIPPVLNVNDFICFLTQYAQGCP